MVPYRHYNGLLKTNENLKQFSDNIFETTKKATFVNLHSNSTGVNAALFLKKYSTMTDSD